MPHKQIVRLRRLSAAAVFSAVALAGAACGGDSDDGEAAPSPTPLSESTDRSESGETPGQGADGPEPTPTPTAPAPPAPSGPPHTAELPWGDFKLADRIADKLARGGQLNVVLSAAATGTGGSGEVMGGGWSGAAGEFDADVNPRVIGPNSPDRAAQIETIESLVNAGSIDCLAVEVDDADAFVDIIDHAVDAGIPVFTVGGDSAESKRFAFYGFDDRAVGRQVGLTAGEWAAEERILMSKAGVLTGDAGDPRYQARMEGFIEGMLEVHSGIEFVNGPGDVESLGFDPEAVYAAAEAWVLAHLDVDMVFHTDQGMAQVARVIADQSLYGDMYTSGFQMGDELANYIRDGVVVVGVVQGLANQAYNAATACGDFLLNGTHEVGQVAYEPMFATRDNVEAVDWSLPENQ